MAEPPLPRFRGAGAARAAARALGVQEEAEKAAHVQALLDKRNEEEAKLVDQLSERMQQVQKDFQHAHNVHAKGGRIKDHDPKRFDEMRESGEIEVEGDSEDSLRSSSESFDEWLENECDDNDVDIQALSENDKKLMQQERNFRKDRRRLQHGREIRDMKKQREQRNKELDLEFERLALEQRLVDLDHQEKSDELKRLERKRKQREQEALDNKRMIEMRKRLTEDKTNNRQRQMAMERDIRRCLKGRRRRRRFREARSSGTAEDLSGHGQLGGFRAFRGRTTTLPGGPRGPEGARTHAAAPAAPEGATRAGDRV
eukprot:gene8391-46405_t